MKWCIPLTTVNNVAEIRGKDGTPITFLWGYQNRFPIARIENATREQVLLKMGFPATATNVLDSWSGGGGTNG